MQEEIAKIRKVSIVWALTGGIALLGIYFLIVSIANSFEHAVMEFRNYAAWISTLVIGFSIQVGLYAHVRQVLQVKSRAKGASSSVAAGAGVSTLSMVACCAHHLTDFLPILGLSAAALFLTDYQTFFMLLGIVSNIFGITYMLSIIAKHHLYFDSNGWFHKLAGYNYKRVFQIEIPVLLFALVIGGLTLNVRSEVLVSREPVQKPVLLETKEVSGNGIWVDINGDFDRPQKILTFKVKLTTHSGSLDFDVDKIASLDINGKKVALPVTWEGSPPGGHHRSGVLTFSNVPASAKSIILILEKNGRLGFRRFEWTLNN